MPEGPGGRAATRFRLPGAALIALLAAAVLTACTLLPSATPSPAGPTASAPAATPTATPSPPPTPGGSPTATPEPALSLELPEGRDARRVSVELAPEVPVDGDGRLVVNVTNLSEERIGELVLRWPTPLREVLFLAPFAPSEQRIVDGGPPLLQEWTKWVEGPGERGEPAGTTSLGWGPLDPGATLTIPLVVEREAPGPVAFDLQLLAGEDLLLLEGGEPAELRVEIG